VWGATAVEEIRERLAEIDGLGARIDRLESILAARLPRVRALHPAVAEALGRLDAATRVGEAVASSGYSHRRFNELFRREVGLPPKVYCRVRRFQGVLARLAAEAPRPWPELAAAAGYADQPHLHRDFREFSGISPGAYRRAAPPYPNHVPLPPPVA
jgi:AraC-like DNA-binding protein